MVLANLRWKLLSEESRDIHIGILLFYNHNLKSIYCNLIVFIVFNIPLSVGDIIGIQRSNYN